MNIPFLLLLIIISFISIVLTSLIQKKSQHSRLKSFIRRVNDTIHDISRRIPTEPNDEFSELAQSINRTLDLHAKSQYELSQNEKRFRKLFNDALTGNYVVSPDGRLLLCNNAFFKIMGFDTIEEALNSNFFSFFPNPHEKSEYLRLINEKTKIEFYEHTYLRRHGGEVITVLENAIGFFDRNGELEQIQGYIIDITERRKIDAIKQSLELEKIVSKVSSRFVGLTDVDDSIDISLMDIGRFTGMSHVYLHLFEKEKISLKPSHE